MRAVFFDFEMQGVHERANNRAGWLHSNDNDRHWAGCSAIGASTLRHALPLRFGFFDESETDSFFARDNHESAFYLLAFHQRIPVGSEKWPDHVIIQSIFLKRFRILRRICPGIGVFGEFEIEAL